MQRALIAKEIGALFTSPVAYAVITVFLLLSGYSFAVTLFVGKQASLVSVFFQAAVQLILLVPLLTMRLFAEERRTGTLELLLTAPVREIANNAGVEGAVVVEQIRLSKSPNFGFNAATEQYEDLVKAGIVDPAKVTRTALQNAASIAGLLLTTEALVAEIKSDANLAAGMAAGGGMGGF